MSTAMLGSPRTTSQDRLSASSYRLTAPATASTAKVARDFVRAILADHYPALIEDARVCVSDAVAHVLTRMTGPYLHVDVSVRLFRVLIAVRSGDRTRGGSYGELWAQAKGLALVRHLSASSGAAWAWDARRRVVSKCVWAELRADAVIA